MSNTQNTTHFEYVWDELMEAIHDNDFDGATKIADRVYDAGFKQIAGELYKEIATAKDDYEANQEPDDNSHATNDPDYA